MQGNGQCGPNPQGRVSCTRKQSEYPFREIMQQQCCTGNQGRAQRRSPGGIPCHPRRQFLLFRQQAPQQCRYKHTGSQQQNQGTAASKGRQIHSIKTQSPGNKIRQRRSQHHSARKARADAEQPLGGFAQNHNQTAHSGGQSRQCGKYQR